MKNDFAQNWEEKVQDKVKLRTYKGYKHTFGTENYLKVNLDRSERSFISQFRLRILPLRIETGRFNRTPLEERLCTLCNSEAVEDENHFLYECEKYQVERKSLMDKACELDNTFKDLDYNDRSDFLFSKMSRQVGKFIKRAYNTRYAALNN